MLLVLLLKINTLQEIIKVKNIKGHRKDRECLQDQKKRVTLGEDLSMKALWKNYHELDTEGCALIEVKKGRRK